MCLFIYLLNIFDYLCTMFWVNKYGIEIEANPISRFFIQNNLLGFVKIVIVGILLYYIEKKNKFKKLNIFLLIIYLMLAVYHIYLLVMTGYFLWNKK